MPHLIFPGRSSRIPACETWRHGARPAGRWRACAPFSCRSGKRRWSASGCVTGKWSGNGIAAGNAIRERVIGVPAGAQSYIEMIRFAAANRLLVEIDYRDKEGKRSTRAIEAYSLRRNQAGEVRLMAVRAEDGQPRSYLLDSILGVRSTQTPYSPRYPIELTPSGPQSIPQTGGGSPSSGGLGVRRAPAIRSATARRVGRNAFGGANGPTYVYRCNTCGKTFNKKSMDGTLGKHKNSRTGYECYGTYGSYVRTKY